MYLICALTLTVLLIVLLLLLAEERRYRKSITHGLASKFWILRERRRFVRFGEEMKIRYNLKQNSSTFHDSKTSDVSRKGLCIIAYEKLKKNTAMNLEIEVPGFSKTVHATGQVMWTKELKSSDEKGRRLFYTGVRFFKIPPEYEAIFLTHLNNLKAY
ncbi:MAG: PilZ domain-containing protein [Candidatus Omnitrophica bacterium]|nr:PilZ domain-containing protein [Candidatus Omnitrophota bacterium]